MNNTYTKTEFKNKLVESCGGCAIRQGWPCSTCVFELSDEIGNEEWHTIIYYRGEAYRGEANEFRNLPKPQERRDILDKIWNLIE